MRQESISRTRILSFVLCLLLAVAGIVGLTACGSSKNSPEAQAEELVAEEVQPALSFKVTGTWPDETAPIQVMVTGEGSDGAAVDQSFKAYPDTLYDSGLPAGSYTFTVAPGSLQLDSEQPLKVEAQSVEFGSEDAVVTLTLAIDDEAVARRAAEKEAEADAAESQGNAPESTDADGRTPDIAIATAPSYNPSSGNASSEGSTSGNASSGIVAGSEDSPASSPAPTVPSGTTVYITDTGNKYHRDTCRFVKQSKHEIDLEDAKAQGYEACKVCKAPS